MSNLHRARAHPSMYSWVSLSPSPNDDELEDSLDSSNEPAASMLSSPDASLFSVSSSAESDAT